MAQPAPALAQKPKRTRTRRPRANTASATGLGSSVVEQVHVTRENVSSFTVTPPHPPRVETPLYAATHKRLTLVEDRPCWNCGVRRSDLRNPARARDRTINPYGATAVETHHWPIERSLLSAVDRDVLATVYPTVLQFKTLTEWVDSEYNMLVLCSACHRTADHAIHHALYQDFVAEKFGRRGRDGSRYEFAASARDVTAVEAEDAAILDAPAAPLAPLAATVPASGAESAPAPAASPSSTAAGNPTASATVGVPVRSTSAPSASSASSAPSTPRRRRSRRTPAAAVAVTAGGQP